MFFFRYLQKYLRTDRTKFINVLIPLIRLTLKTFLNFNYVRFYFSLKTFRFEDRKKYPT